jgi:hypothetical protein
MIEGKFPLNDAYNMTDGIDMKEWVVSDPPRTSFRDIAKTMCEVPEEFVSKLERECRSLPSCPLTFLTLDMAGQVKPLHLQSPIAI